MNATAEWINRRLPELVAEHGIVGAQVAVLVDGEIIDGAAGVRNTVTGDPVTTDSIFQIGSITKVWTATLVQELVNEGLLDLDRPVRDVLPEFRLGDEDAAKVITPRQLLCHTAGFDGDQFYDTGADDDAVAKFVDLLADSTQVTPPGELFTYCNAGYVVLGRIVELLRGKPFHVVLRERLFTPLDLPTASAHHREYAAQEVAEGHMPSDGEMKPVAERLAASNGPAGSVPAMNARDLLAFVQLHLGTKAFDAMRETQVHTPDFGTYRRWGLGWSLHDYPGGATGIGHTGSTMGYQASLRVLPESGVAVAILTNGGDAFTFIRAVNDHLLPELAGVRLPDLPVPPMEPVPADLSKIAGSYRCSAFDIHLSEGADGRLHEKIEARNEVFAKLLTRDEREYVVLRDDALITAEPEDGIYGVLVLCGRNEQDRVRWVHWGRAAARQ